MPELNNRQHEQFARNLAAGFSRTEAAKRSEYNDAGAHNAGHRVAKRPEVHARVRELIAKRVETTVVPREWIESEIVLIHKKAKAKSELSVSRSCLELLARMNGYLVERSERHSETLHVHAIDRNSLNALLSRSLADLPAAERQAIMLEAPQELRNVIEAACENVTPAAGNE